LAAASRSALRIAGRFFERLAAAGVGIKLETDARLIDGPPAGHLVQH
jgi:hypothetical protein